MQNVDVIIPTHNCIFIDEAIKSALDQSYHDINIYIVDDGSTDNTKERVNILLESNQGKIHYFKQKQKGPASARNTGIEQGSGDYISFLDADDIWLPHKIEKQLEVFKKNPDIGFVYCDNYFIDRNGDKISDYVRKIKLVEGNILLDFFMDFFLITSSVMLKRSCLETVGFLNENLQVGEDFEFFLRLADNFKAGVVREKLFLRRVWNESLSKQDFELNRNTDLMTIQYFIDHNEDFRRSNRVLINNRFNQLYTNLGYAFLQHNKRMKALKAFFKTKNYKKRAFKLKYIILCILPKFLTKIFQKGGS